MKLILKVCTSAVFLALGISQVQGAEAPAPLDSDRAATVQQIIDKAAPSLLAAYKDLHRNPELAFMEVRTANILATHLKSLGFEVKTGIGKTGVVGVLRNGPGPVVMYRADMDANAVEEATGLEYASRVRVKRSDGIEVPVGHMCGHDAHVVWLMGVASAVAALKNSWSGTLVLVGQPAEETIQGAAAMVDDGLYKRHGVPVPDFLLALHTAPIPTGTIASVGGLRQAGTDQLDVTFRGVGVHGSTPQLGKDPVVMAASAIMQYQTIVSRIVDPLETAVLTVGSVQAGADNNVIPESALLKLNLRYFNPAVREQMLGSIKAINDGIALSNGMPADKMPIITMKGGSGPLVNDQGTIDRLNRMFMIAARIGESALIKSLPKVTGSEDAHMLVRDYKTTKIGYVLVGTAEPELFAAAQKRGLAVPFFNHNPAYKVDEAAIAFGVKIGTLATLEMLGRR